VHGGSYGCQLENVVLVHPFSIACSSRVCPLLVRLVGDEEGGVDGLHAGGAGEAPHEPVVDALGVVGVHARQVAHAVADAELDHADHAFSVLFGAVVDASGQVLNETHPLRDLDLFFLGQLTRRPGYVWRGVVYRSIVLRGGKTTDIVIVASAAAVTGPASAATGTRGRVVGPGGGGGVMDRGGGAEQRDVVGRRGFQAVAHDELAHGVQEVGRGGGRVRRRRGHCHGRGEGSISDRWRGRKRPEEGWKGRGGEKTKESL